MVALLLFLTLVPYLVALFLPFAVIAVILYIRVIRPAQFTRLRSDMHEVQLQLSEERRLRADLVKWIEDECSAHKVKPVERALKKRVDERLEELRLARSQRQQRIR